MTEKDTRRAPRPSARPAGDLPRLPAPLRPSRRAIGFPRLRSARRRRPARPVEVGAARAGERRSRPRRRPFPGVPERSGTNAAEARLRSSVRVLPPPPGPAPLSRPPRRGQRGRGRRAPIRSSPTPVPPGTGAERDERRGIPAAGFRASSPASPPARRRRLVRPVEVGAARAGERRSALRRRPFPGNPSGARRTPRKPGRGRPCGFPRPRPPGPAPPSRPPRRGRRGPGRRAPIRSSPTPVPREPERSATNAAEARPRASVPSLAPCAGRRPAAGSAG